MTTLGLIFILAYALGFVVKRHVGLLAVAAAAIPFNDSAALIIGEIPVSPFYLGMVVYLPLTYLRIGIPRPGSTMPWLLGLWACAVTLIGPTLFARMPVFASGVGIDRQVGRLSELVYTNSNFAQVSYLVVNLALLMALSSSEDTKNWIPPIPAVVGTSVATLAWWFRHEGIEWPDELFRNNTPNAYGYVKTARFAAQFSEPSHLAAFALTSAVLLSAVVVVLRPRPAIRIFLLAMVAADIVIIVDTGSATALVGAGIFAVVATSWVFYRVAVRGARVSVGVALTVLVLMGTALVIGPQVVAYARDVIDYKVNTGTSLRSRTAADLNSWRIFLDSGTLGVGLGSNRSSSLLALLLSTIGLVGTTLFLLIMGKAIRDGLRERTRRAWAAGLAVLLAASFFSLPDFVSPMMWLLAGFCWNAQRHMSDQTSAQGLSASSSRLVGGGRADGFPAIPPKPKVAEQ